MRKGVLPTRPGIQDFMTHQGSWVIEAPFVDKKEGGPRPAFFDAIACFRLYRRP